MTTARLLISVGVGYSGITQVPGDVASRAGATDTAGPPMAHGFHVPDDVRSVIERATRANTQPIMGFRLTDMFLAAKTKNEPPSVARFDLRGEFPTREQAVEAARRMAGELERSAGQFADLLWDVDGDKYKERIEL